MLSLEYFRKHWEAILLGAFLTVFIAIYSYRIVHFPIFEDEAELLFISEKVAQNPSQNLFLLMKYGPLPALSWLVAAFSVFTKDSLLGGRLLNVLLASSLIIWNYLVTKFYKLPKRFFIFSSLLITFSPILLLNARVALWDTAVMVFSAWYSYLFLVVAKRPTSLNMLFFLFFLTFAFLVKFTSFFALPGIFLLIGARFYRKKVSGANQKALWAVLFSLFTFGLVIYSFKTPVIGDAASSFITQSGPSAILAKIYNNIWLYINWLKVYYSLYPLYLISFGYVLYTYRVKKTPAIIGILFIWFLVSSSTTVSFNRFFYPRHILMLLVPIATITAYFLLKIPGKLSILVVGAIIVSQIFLFRDILVNYFDAEIAKEDRFQYFEDYTSGVNVENIAGDLRGLSKGQATVVWLDGSWVMEYGLRREFRGEENVFFRSFVEFSEKGFGPPQQIIEDSTGVNYLIVNKREPPNIKSFTLIKEFSWGGHKRQYLYRL